MDEREPEVTPVMRDDDEETASSFAADLHPETLSFGVDKPAPTVCQWCNTPLEDATVAICPHCGAALQPLDPDVEVPGLTTMSPEARAAQARVERKLREAMATRSLGRSLLIGNSPPADPSPVIEELVSADEGVLAGSYQPPPQAVQDLIRRMEMEALMARQEILPPLSEDELAAGVAGEAAIEDAAAPADEPLAQAVSDASEESAGILALDAETPHMQPFEAPATTEAAADPATGKAGGRGAKRARKPRRGTNSPPD